jgi:hypothetical protein
MLSIKEKMVILKLDFEKHFDKIEHEVIIQIMIHIGFPMRWVNWIKEILSSGTSSILLNGTPRKVFHCKRGVRQSDLLSPLLFIPLQVGYTTGFPIIQYADNTLLIVEACPM